MAAEINRSCTPDQAKTTREMFLSLGWTEVSSLEEAQRLEASTGGMYFVDQLARAYMGAGGEIFRGRAT